jgi:CxxC motif-containing protein
MEIINKHICKLPVKVKDIIIENVFGANIIATTNMEE